MTSTRDSVSKLLLIISFVLGITLAIALGARADELQRSFPAADGGRLRLALDYGQVQVVQVEGDEVRIEARARGVGASGVHFDVRSEGGDVVLTTRSEPWVTWLQSLPRIQVRAFVPASWSVERAELGPSEMLGSFVVHQP
jgi:hypothetical protein